MKKTVFNTKRLKCHTLGVFETIVFSLRFMNNKIE
jgi:hypothetical protein